MFNLTVDTAHTFYVGSNGWLVHNEDVTKPKLTKVERSILAEATEFFNPNFWDKVKEAYRTGNPTTLYINNRRITIEPNATYSFSGLTDFEHRGFTMGPVANPLTDAVEAKKTVLQELFRLYTSNASQGVSGALAQAETNAAFHAANRMMLHLPCD